MLRRIILCAAIVLCGTSAIALAGNVFMVFDIVDFRDIQNYRSSDMIAASLDKRQSEMDRDNRISTTGLPELHISGSAPLDRSGVERLAKNTAGYKLYVLDLRQEAHAYLNSTPITWYAQNDWINRGLSDKQAAAADAERIAWLGRQDVADVYLNKEKSRLLHVAVLTATDEETFIRSFNLAYRRYFVSDYMMPRTETIDSFVQFCDALPQNAWLHFHCRSGRGRTTTFMVMYDILKNADKVSLADIVSRQAELAPNYNVFTSDDLEAGADRDLLVKERITVLKNFYEFSRWRLNDNYKGSWPEYLKYNK